MSIKQLRYQKIVQSIPCYPQTISTTEIRDVLLRHDLLSDCTEKSQMRMVQRELCLVMADHRSFEEVPQTRPKQYRVAEGHRHPANVAMSSVLPLKLIEEEIVNMLPATMQKEVLALLSSANSTDDKQLNLWLERFCYLPSEFQLSSPPFNQGFVDVIELALLSKRDLRITYQKRGSESPLRYDVTPLGIILRGNAFYLAAKKIDDGSYRSFLLTRIHTIELGFSTIDPDMSFNLKDYVLENEPWFHGGEKVRVTLNIDNYRGMHMLGESPIGDNQVIISQGEHETQIEVDVRQSREFENWLTRTADFVEVVAPQSLREKLTDRLTRAYLHYGLGKS
ncbi:helix-turn-helix transcriptional regulator [Vibrio hangzhouensis]|uniref:helix-turn-helix transcriptional regulator n=1 Tax=Vibrio hangzhouensis TaxID=462991 RepID=UPI001C955331|nr:WYL domain-containing protein [Vibrio hangzhouensis]MBY6197373.1 WYL domain-containing protein [Vibrio hangzhouensis]